MPEFNPDDYLKSNSNKEEFNPDSYLKENGVKKKTGSNAVESTGKNSGYGGVGDLNSLLSGNQVTAPLILTPQKQHEYRKAQKYVKPATKPKTLTEAVDDDNNYLGALWNQVAGSVSDAAAGAYGLASKAIYQGNPLAIAENIMNSVYGKAYKSIGKEYNPSHVFSPEGTLEKAIEAGNEVQSQVKGFIDKAKDTGSEDYAEEIQRGFDVTNGLDVKDAKALPLMIARLGTDIGLSIPTAGLSFVAQGYQQGIDDYDRSVKETGVEPDNSSRELFGIVYGVINGTMDKLGVDLITKNTAVSKALKNAILKIGLKSLINTEGKITSELIENIFSKIATQTFNKAKTVGVKSAIASFGEGVTEGIQGGLSDSLKALTNKLSDKEIFNEKKIAGNFWSNRINDLAGGAILGGLAGGVTHGIRSSSSYISERIAESTNPEQIEEFKADIAAEVESGKLDADRGNELIQAIDKYSEANQRLPQGLKVSERAKALRLMSERDAIREQRSQIEAAIQTVDEALAPQGEQDAEIVRNKEEQKNDEIRETVNGEKYKYFEDPEKEGKYYKQLGEGKPEEITKEYYDLQKQDSTIEVKDNERSIREEEKEVEQLKIEEGEIENAIQEQSPVEIPLEQTPGIGEEVDGRIPEPGLEETPIEITPEEIQGNVKEEIAPDLVDYSDATPETGKITKSAIAESREQLGLPEIEVDATRKDAEVKADADELIKSGKVFNVIDDIIAGKQKSVLDKEVNAMVGVLAEKNTQLAKANGKLMNAVRDGNQRAIDAAVIEKDGLVKEIADIQTAGRLAGREAGRTLRQFQISRVQDNSLSGFIETALRNNDNKALTPEQLKTAEEAHSKFESLWNESQAKIAEMEAQIAKLEQDYAVLRLKKQNDTERTRQRKSLKKEEQIKQIREERKVILDDIFKIAKKQRSNLSSTPFTAEYFKPMAQLAKNYVAELSVHGEVLLDDLVSKIYNDVKDEIEGVTERDVRDVISGYGKESAMTKDALRLQVEELKTQGRLISAIEDAEAKVERSTGTKKKEASERVKELRQTLRALTGNEIGVASLKTRLKNRINELNKRIADGDYVKPDKHVLELDEEAKRLRDEALRVKRDYEIGTEKYKLANRTKTEKTIDDFANLVGLTKSLKATWDLSAPFRQGIVASVNHPIEALKAFHGMHKAAISEKFYERWRNDLEASPSYKLMEDSGLSLTTNKSAKVLAKEEDFSTTLSEKVPFVKGSERAYSFYLNYLRANIFIDAATELQRDGYSFDSHPNEFKSLARVINNETGRGGLGSLEKHSSLAGNVLWSPRLMASRINLFTSMFDHSYTPRARQKAAIDLLRFIGAVSGVLFLASTNDDWDIEWNPLSSNFGKIKRGDTRYSVMGGMESYITFMARMLTGLTKNAKGKIKELGGDSFGSRSRGDIAETFFRGKANPIAGIVANLAYGKDVVGNNYEAWDVADEAIPLVLPEIMDAYNAGGLPEVIKTIPATTYGVGVSRYSDKKKPKDKAGFIESIYYTAKSKAQGE